MHISANSAEPHISGSAHSGSGGRCHTPRGRQHAQAACQKPTGPGHQPRNGGGRLSRRAGGRGGRRPLRQRRPEPYATRPPARPGRPNVGECFRSGGAAADVLGEARPRSIRSLNLKERPDVSVGILRHQSCAPLGQSIYILYQPFTPFTSYISHDKHKLIHIFQ